MKHLTTTSRLWIGLAAAIAALGVAIHLGCIAGGPSYYAFFGAPPQIVASARRGTWLAPVGTAGIAALMGICAAYACSALGLIQRLPLLRTALAGIAVVCLARAFVLLPFAWIHPELRTPFEFIAALTWGVAGIGFSVAFATARLR